MKVWRVAHESLRDGGHPVGPYMAQLAEEDELDLEVMYKAHCDPNTHPTPGRCGQLDGILPEERCGFDSRFALDIWFDGYAELLARLGFQIYVYVVDSARRGRQGQVLFDPEDAELLCTESLCSYTLQLELF